MKMCILSCHVLQEIHDPTEDEISIASHLLALQKECAKTTPSSTIIAEKMARTLSHRRQMVREKTIGEVLEAYPALRVEKEVYHVLTCLNV
jgi:hypothetical protein